MKIFIKFIAALFVLLLPIVQTEAQCPNNNTQFGTSSAPVTVGQLVTLSTCIYGGEYRLVNNLQAGSVYSFETCGDTDFDTQVTVYDASTNSLVAFNDDFCGLQSKVSFTSNGNAVRVLIDRFNCANQSSCMTLGVTRVTGAPTATPCSNVSPLNCGIAGSFNITGAGAWNNLGGPWSTPGEEQVFTLLLPYLALIVSLLTTVVDTMSICTSSQATVPQQAGHTSMIFCLLQQIQLI